MLRMFLKMVAIAALMSFPVYGQQSLGDIAREYRDKQAAEDANGTRPKLFTNKDLPANPNGSDESEPAQQPAHPAAIARNADDPFSHQFANREFANRPSPNQRYSDQRYAGQHFADERAAEQWRQRILMQEDRVASLQARIDQMTARARSTGGTVQSEGPYTRYQELQMERLAQMHQMLDEQKRHLDQMQDAARRAGMHTSVYDP